MGTAIFSHFTKRRGLRIDQFILIEAEPIVRLADAMLANPEFIKVRILPAHCDLNDLMKRKKRRIFVDLDPRHSSSFVPCRVIFNCMIVSIVVVADLNLCVINLPPAEWFYGGTSRASVFSGSRYLSFQH